MEGPRLLPGEIAHRCSCAAAALLISTRIFVISTKIAEFFRERGEILAHPALASLALYRVRNFPRLLEDLQLPPTVLGYETLRNSSETRRESLKGIPTGRTVAAMLNRENFTKYASCLEVLKLINRERISRRLVELYPPEEIEENEYWIPNLEELLRGGGGRKGGGEGGSGASASSFEASLNKLCGRYDGMKQVVTGLCDGQLTTRERCGSVVDAIRARFAQELYSTNQARRDQENGRVIARPLRLDAY